MSASALRQEHGVEAARGDTAAADPKFLLELIVADLHWSALELGSLALMTAAAATRGSTVELRFCRHLVYDDTRVMRLALRYGADAGLAEDIRRKLDQEGALDVPDRPFTDKLMFWQAPPQPGTVLDPEKEAQRLRENAALGQSPEQGDTPIIQRTRKSMFDIF